MLTDQFNLYAPRIHWIVPSISEIPLTSFEEFGIPLTSFELFGVPRTSFDFR